MSAPRRRTSPLPDVDATLRAFNAQAEERSRQAKREQYEQARSDEFIGLWEAVWTSPADDNDKLGGALLAVGRWIVQNRTLGAGVARQRLDHCLGHLRKLGSPAVCHPRTGGEMAPARPVTIELLRNAVAGNEEAVRA